MEIFENLSASSRLGQEELDAYSRAVRKVTRNLEPAVISVGTASGRGGDRELSVTVRSREQPDDQ